MVLVELGTTTNPSPIYTEGSCLLDDDNAILCDYDYANIDYDPDHHALFIEQDGIDGYEPDDFLLTPVWSPLDDLWVQSIPAREAAAAANLSMPDRADLETTKEFWEWRAAPRKMNSAITHYPNLAAIVGGSEEDHVLTGAADHPHITGMIHAMQAAGIRWSRLNPDAAYATHVALSPEDFADLDANLPLTVGEAVTLEPSTAQGGHGTDYLTASVLELLDRAHTNEWSNNLDAVLQR